MHTIAPDQLATSIKADVECALREDIGKNDISALLIPSEVTATAFILSRQEAILCGRPWVDEIFRQLDPSVKLDWKADDGSRIKADDTLVTLTGPARSLLTGERTALNFLQLLSATATSTANYVERVKHTGVKLLDTRKTLPGLRLAQKYAVHCGGGNNHRLGLYDAFLIKENHIAACGGIAEAVRAARKLAPGKLIEVEVENLDELEQALQANAPMIMLDNFTLEDTRQAIKQAAGKARLEASGGINDSTLVAIAETGIDYISMGTLTKDVESVDLSMGLSTND